jgi:LuxR family maltose regulon positive regulatory protein
MVRELRGDLAGAEEEYVHAAQLARTAAWPIDLGHTLILHAELRRRRKDPAGARTLAREARDTLSVCADPGILADKLERLERLLQLRAAAPAPASSADAELSERELAVLRLLATDLSQREIGSQLFVSFNTVKTHTRTVFRKLGVTNRADAVAKARELGVL